MNIQQLLYKTSQGMFWNGLAYGVYKALFVALSFILYQKLPIELFSTWAITNSTIFIFHLWLSCGFKKSVPRYCPVFAKNKSAHRQFVKGLVLFQGVLLVTTGIPLLWLFLKNLNYSSFLIRAAFGVFLFEGMVSLLKLIYHAHFWQRQFNLLHTACILTEMVLNFCLIIWGMQSSQLVVAFFITKIGSGMATTILSLAMLPQLYKDRTYPGIEQIDIGKTTKDFIIHSLTMWATTICKSLSERNILVPYLTFTAGPASANLFKVAQDGALLFQRIVLKTIGVTDTSLFSHLEEENKSSQFFKKAFVQFLKKITLLCVGTFILVILCTRYTTHIIQNIDLIKIFIIAIAGYAFEIILSPYERVLETKREYKLIWLCKTPYLMSMLTTFIFFAPGRFSLAFFFFIVQITRFSEALLIAHVTTKKYQLSSPADFFSKRKKN